MRVNLRLWQFQNMTIELKMVQYCLRYNLTQDAYPLLLFSICLKFVQMSIVKLES